ncbi:hypothetical protein ODR15_21425, partial [Escherichia coli]|nr:hypothetical protein [Escherichia coli]
AQQNKSAIVRLRSFVCIADDAPEKRVNMSSPEYYPGTTNTPDPLQPHSVPAPGDLPHAGDVL